MHAQQNFRIILVPFNFKDKTGPCMTIAIKNLANDIFFLAWLILGPHETHLSNALFILENAEIFNFKPQIN